jgi:hypothetical protein
MTLGRAHVVLSLVLLALAIAFTMWLQVRPASTASRPLPAVPLLDGRQQSGPSVTGQEAPEAIDPATLPPVTDVALDRAPEWRRNPFAGVRARVMEPAPPPPSSAEEPDLVLASILHSPQRRLAIVNGRIVRAGDRIGGVTIREIEPRAVVIETAGGARRTLELRPSPWRAGQ